MQDGNGWDTRRTRVKEQAAGSRTKFGPRTDLMFKIIKIRAGAEDRPKKKKKKRGLLDPAPNILSLSLPSHDSPLLFYALCLKHSRLATLLLPTLQIPELLPSSVSRQRRRPAASAVGRKTTCQKYSPEQTVEAPYYYRRERERESSELRRHS